MYQMKQSMSRKGNCWDNAPAESFFHTIKVEELNWTLYANRDEAQAAVFRYIEMFYNRLRMHSGISYATPEELELNWRKAIIELAA
jgi:transposase InsO family protein